MGKHGEEAALQGQRPRPSPSRPVVIGALGLAQIIAWGSSYYLPAVLAPAIAAQTGWPLPWVVGGLSLGLVVAGLASPRIGRLIDREGGRRVLAASAGLMGLGMLALAAAPTLTLHIAAWLVIGLGMGAGLYDAAFATLGRAYGERARATISALTLVGGFAATVDWPLSAWMLAHLGWRGACLGWAALDFAVLLPLYLLAMPRAETRPDEAAVPAAEAPPVARDGGLFALLASANTLGQSISAVMSVHLLVLLRALGTAPTVAVAFGAMLGPAQVAARAVEMATARRHHPIWTMQAWVGMVAAGLALMWAWPAALPVALACYGGGIGIGSIARGTVPLALFGSRGYAVRMGRLALPNLLAQAAAPMLVAVLLEHAGARTTLGALVAAAGVDVALSLAVLRLSRSRRYAAAR